MGILSAITGFGSIADAISGVMKVASQVLGMAHDKEQRNEGATAQREVTDETTLDTIERVNAPVSTAESDSLWDANKKRFGTANTVTNGKTV